MKLDLIFCRSCDCAHEPGQHKRRGTSAPSSWDDGSVPQKAVKTKPKFDPGHGKKAPAPKAKPVKKQPVAQSGSARALGARGQRFKSSQADHVHTVQFCTPCDVGLTKPPRPDTIPAKRVDPRPPGSRNEYQAGLMRIIRAAKREGITPVEWRAKYGDEPPEPIVRGKKRR